MLDFCGYWWNAKYIFNKGESAISPFFNGLFIGSGKVNSFPGIILTVIMLATQTVHGMIFLLKLTRYRIAPTFTWDVSDFQIMNKFLTTLISLRHVTVIGLLKIVVLDFHAYWLIFSVCLWRNLVFEIVEY